MATVVCNDSAYKPIVAYYIGHKLRSHNICISGFDVEPDHIPLSFLTLRRIGHELESENSELFSSMCDQLMITPNTAYPTFQGIADEIFTTGMNWGRIVAFLSFGSTLALHSATRNDMGPAFVTRILNWITRYMDTHLDSWINANQSWDGFVDFFSKPGDDDSSIRSGAFFFSAVAGLGLGALLMLSCK